jgi:hypothetical protein
VHGVKRRASLLNTDGIDHLYQDPHDSNVRMAVHEGDLTDATTLIRIAQCRFVGILVIFRAEDFDGIASFAVSHQGDTL